MKLVKSMTALRFSPLRKLKFEVLSQHYDEANLYMEATTMKSYNTTVWHALPEANLLLLRDINEKWLPFSKLLTLVGFGKGNL